MFQLKFMLPYTGTFGVYKSYFIRVNFRNIVVNFFVLLRSRKLQLRTDRSFSYLLIFFRYVSRQPFKNILPKDVRRRLPNSNGKQCYLFHFFLLYDKYFTVIKIKINARKDVLLS